MERLTRWIDDGEQTVFLKRPEAECKLAKMETEYKAKLKEIESGEKRQEES